ncbi:MAG: UPF0755 protein [bacterium]
MIRFLLSLIIAGVGAGWFGWTDYQRYLKQPIALSESGQRLTVERGWSAKKVADELEQQGVINKRYWFDLYARLSKKAGSIKSGEFNLTGPMTVPQLFDALVEGQTVQYSLALIEGSNWKQAIQRVAQSDDLVQTLDEQTRQSAETLMETLGLKELHPEGQFFSDTYAFPKGTSDVEYLRRANAMLNTVLQEEWANRSDNLPLESPYEALILASIVEKETAVASERPLIAGVFLSRLIKRMRLQTDPTVIYGMGDRYDGNIRRSDLTTDTPYNTYTRGGLPPTPISMVGREAIHAVLHPEATKSLYFVARGDGTHQFSETLEQHNVAVRKYQLKR